MDEIKQMVVTHHCLECGSPFNVMQGSRQQLCDACISKKVRQGRPKKTILVISNDNRKQVLEAFEKATKDIKNKPVGYSKDKQLRKQRDG